MPTASYLWGTINVQNQGLVVRDDEPSFLPAATASLLHVMQEAAQYTVFSNDRGLFLQGHIHTELGWHRRLLHCCPGALGSLTVSESQSYSGNIGFCVSTEVAEGMEL